MRYEVKISAVDLMLDHNQARMLLAEIDSIDGLEYIAIHTGLSYDSEIEKEGSNSEDLLTTIIFFVNGDAEFASDIGCLALARIESMHEIRKNGLWFTLTDVNNISQYSLE